MRIVSDGTGADTVIFVDDKPLNGVSHVSIVIDPKDLVKVTLTMNPGHLDIHGKIYAVDFICPSCGNKWHHVCEPENIPF